MKLTKMIYIASPYSCYHWCFLVRWAIELYRYFKVTQVTGRLQDKFKYAFIGPITQSHETSKYMKSRCGRFESWALRDLTFISRCNEVWVVTMDGWKESVGVQEEIKFAKTILGCKVKYVNPKTLKITRSPK